MTCFQFFFGGLVLMLSVALVSAQDGGAATQEAAATQAAGAHEVPATRPFDRPDVKEVTERIACTCGCPHMQISACFCGVADGVRQQVATQLDAGLTADEIVDQYVAEHGTWALAVPPKQGFHHSIFVLPVLVLGLGSVLVFFLGRRFAGRRAPVTETAAPVAVSEEDERYRQELSHLLEDDR
ncbi:MAG: cytochrome c-type biogenesis protein CcmH [Acidobacteriota bacterium]